MLICKMGKEHIDNGKNCQDFAVKNNDFKMIVDGCSSSVNSEVGAQLFCNLLPKNNYDIRKTFNFLRVIFDTDRELKDHLLFTIVMVKETDNFFQVAICGDGFIIKQKHDNTIEFEEIDYDNEPPYFAYNLIYNRSSLTKYENGVGFQHYVFSKDEYKNIGVASDGIRYILDSIYKDEFIEILNSNRDLKMKLFINRNIKHFKDDISIAF